MKSTLRLLSSYLSLFFLAAIAVVPVSPLLAQEDADSSAASHSALTNPDSPVSRQAAVTVMVEMNAAPAEFKGTDDFNTWFHPPDLGAGQGNSAPQASASSGNKDQNKDLSAAVTAGVVAAVREFWGGGE